MTNILLSSLRAVIKAYPAVIPHLKGKARWVAFGSAQITPVPMPPGYMGFRWSGKTVEFYRSTLERLIRSVYNGELGGEFIDILANLIYGQLDQAYRQAWDEEGDGEEYPEYLADSFEQMYLAEYDHVDSYFQAIIDARVDETSIEPLLERAALWANRYEDAQNEARRLIALENGDKLEWVEGDTEEKCEICIALDGIVAYASTWDELGVKPQSPPNERLTCGGWKCQCRLEATDKRVTLGSREKILSIISKG
jgi:hypothetical protein